MNAEQPELSFDGPPKKVKKKKWKNSPEYMREYALKNPEKIKAYWLKYSQSEKGQAKAKEYREKNKAKRKAYQAGWSKQFRPKVMAAYGGKCSCCGESEPAFLAIDHKHGGGNKHRKEFSGCTWRMMQWIVKNGYPPEFQILCHNCNMAKHVLGECPHQSKRAGLTIV